jgi:hypothetical protein
MSTVVTMVVSRADKKRQSHSPAMMMCSRFELIFGTTGALEVVVSSATRLPLASTMMLLRVKTAGTPSYCKQPATKCGAVTCTKGKTPAADTRLAYIRVGLKRLHAFPLQAS